MPSHYLWRISKYDPAKRNATGHFLGDEWTCFTEIGQEINGRPLTYPDYFAVESKYVEAILSFIDEAGVKALGVSELSIRFQSLIKADDLFRDLALTPSAVLGGAIAEGSTLSRDVWADVIRLSLRDAIWCKLDAPKDFKLRLEWDYQAYVRSPAPSPRSEARTAALGLFAEAGIFPAEESE